MGAVSVVCPIIKKKNENVEFWLVVFSKGQQAPCFIRAVFKDKRLSYVFLPRLLLQRITLIWNSLPKNIKDSDTISSFKSKLKSFYFTRLLNVFDGDNFRSFKLICPKCRRVNIFSVSTC